MVNVYVIVIEVSTLVKSHTKRKAAQKAAYGYDAIGVI